MIKETENEETRLFATFLSLVAFRLGGGGGGGPPAPLVLTTPMLVTLMLFVIDFVCFFVCLPLCACQSYTNGSILYDHAKYVILLVKVKIVLNSGCNLKL